MKCEADTLTAELPGMEPARVNVPATLAGRCANGYERGAGRLVHLVPATQRELRTGIAYYARSICGRTHGHRSAGWSHNPGLVATCAKCLRLAAQGAA